MAEILRSTRRVGFVVAMMLGSNACIGSGDDNPKAAAPSEQAPADSDKSIPLQTCTAFEPHRWGKSSEPVNYPAVAGKLGVTEQAVRNNGIVGAVECQGGTTMEQVETGEKIVVPEIGGDCMPVGLFTNDNSPPKNGKSYKMALAFCVPETPYGPPAQQSA